MAWKEVDTIKKALAKAADVKVRVTGGGGLHVHLSSAMIERLDWRHGTTLTLLVGSAEAAGKIALKPKAKGALSVSVIEMKRTARSMAKVYVGHFDQLVSETRKSEEPGVEQKNDQLILTMPDGWLKAA